MKFKEKEQEDIEKANINPKKTDAAILLANKIGFVEK